MDVEADISEDITDIGDVSAQCAAECLEVEAPKPYDQELYQLLSHAAESGDLESLLTITDTHLTELSSINAAFALIHAARMLQVDSPKRDALQSPKLVNLIRHVENIVMGHRLEGAVAAETAESEDSSSELMKVEDQGLHMAWTVSVICWGLGLLGHKNDKLLSCLASMVKPLLPHLSPHQLQNCLWAFASLEMKDSGPFFGAAVEIIEPRITLFSHESLVAILTSFAMVKVLSANLFDAAAKVLVEAGDTLRPQDVANCTWAFATLRHPHPAIFSGLGDSAARRLHEFRPEQVAVLVWAFALVRWRLEKLFEAVQHDVVDRYTHFSPDSLANVLHSFTLVGHDGAQVILEVAAPHIAINLSEYKSKALAKLVFATTKTSEPVKGDLVEILAQEFLRRADSMSMSLLTAMLLAFWKADLSNPDFFRQAASKVQACLKDFETSGFIRLLKIFAAAGAMEPAFIQDMVDEAQRRLPSLRATEFVNLAKTLLQIGQASPFLLESLAEHGDKVLPQMSQKELTSFLRSLSGLGLTSASSSGEALFRQAASKATRQLLRSKEDRRYSLKSSDLACLSRVFARAAAATGPLTDKYQASAETPCAELREAIERFLQAAVEEARQRLDEFQASPACLVGVLWAASECKVECESLMKATIAVLLPSDAPGGDNSLQRLQLPELAELAKALTHLGVEQVELYKALADVAVACMQEPNNVGPPEEHLVPAAELLSLLATVGISASVLASTAADKVLSVLDQADTGEIKLPAWVIARCIAGLALSVPVGRILGALKLLARAATARAVELLPEERALIFWSLSLQGCYEEFFEAVLEQTPWTLWAPKLQDELVISGNGYVPSPKLVALCQVHLADLALRIEGGGDRAGLSAAQRTHVVEAAQVMARIRPEIPAEAEPISQALISMELLPSLGSSTPEGLPLSIRVSSSSIRGSGASTLSIEVDRPGDLLFDIDSGKAHRFLPTALRRRLLWCLGYTVVVLPWYEVNCCDNEQLVALLRARLAEVSPPRPRFTSDRGGQSKLHEADERNRVSSAEASGNSSSSVSSWQAMRPPPGL